MGHFPVRYVSHYQRVAMEKLGFNMVWYRPYLWIYIYMIYGRYLQLTRGYILWGYSLKFRPNIFRPSKNGIGTSNPSVQPLHGHWYRSNGPDGPDGLKIIEVIQWWNVVNRLIHMKKSSSINMLVHFINIYIYNLYNLFTWVLLSYPVNLVH